tara:strand:+ start:129 stop:674 length:546 start_codon:yes stop_codon:yes gene_type:complete
MKYILMLVLMTSASSASAAELAICTGEFAFCGASPATPTGQSITVRTATGTAEFREAVAVCPIVMGPALADLNGGNMKGSCKARRGQVWSLFFPFKEVQQAPTWDVAPTNAHTFVTSEAYQMTNMFSFLCKKANVVNGVRLANCYGPINENLDGTPLALGTLVFSGAPANAAFAVSAAVPK